MAASCYGLRGRSRPCRRWSVWASSRTVWYQDADSGIESRTDRLPRDGESCSAGTKALPLIRPGRKLNIPRGVFCKNCTHGADETIASSCNASTLGAGWIGHYRILNHPTLPLSEWQI